MIQLSSEEAEMLAEFLEDARHYHAHNLKCINDPASGWQYNDPATRAGARLRTEQALDHIENLLNKLEG
jgi:hypothetical protein